MSQRDSVLVLWDVDHTLVSIRDVSQPIYEYAFKMVTGRPLERLASMTGRTEHAIISETLVLNGVETSEIIISDFCAALGVAVHEQKDRIRETGISLPGAACAISALRGESVVQSVVTGNIYPIAKVKLNAFNLTSDLDLEIGGFGDDGSDRADLVRLARKRARDKYRVPFADERVFVIGDTPYDIKGARDAGVIAVGVATGNSSVKTLEECGADLVLTDLTDIGALCDIVFDSRER